MKTKSAGAALRTVGRESVQMGIIRELKRYISESRILPGEKLPPAAEMAKAMGVSLAALREALQRLDMAGMLNIVNGRGVFLVNPEMARIGDPDLLSDPAYIIDAINVRWLLETEVVRLVIRRATDAQLDIAQAHLNKLLERYAAGLETRNEDKAFHLSLYRITNNQAMFEVISSVLRSFALLWEYPMGLEHPFYDSAPEHARLFAAIRDRDEEGAVRICEKTRDDMIAVIRSAERKALPTTKP